MKVYLYMLLALPALCFGAHPLSSDDTGTQGVKNWQLEFNADRSSREADGERTTIHMGNLALTYGYADGIDLGINVPYLRVSSDTADAPGAAVAGHADAAILMKWRFYEKDGYSLALKPQMTLHTGDERRGLGNGRVGYGLNLLGGVEINKQTNLIGNLGYTFNNNQVGNRSGLWNVSVGILHSINDKNKLVFEVCANRNPDAADRRNPAFATVGIIHGVNDRLDIDVGYRKGINRAEMDYSWGAGVTFRW